jgi:hypothetical protein
VAEARADCDAWSEPIGPWHLRWQSLVRREFIEVVKGPHRADIFNGRTVVELQHSSIGAEDITAREAFYGDMVWMFDATHRFAYVKSGERSFFSFGQAKHIGLCKKPVFLDFGFDLVQVERFTDAITLVSGFGLTRSWEWFADFFLSDVRQPGTSMAAFVPQPDGTDPWARKSPVWKMKYPTKWLEPGTGQAVVYPEWTPYIEVMTGWYRRGDKENTTWDYDEVIDKHPEIATGWTKEGLRQMHDFLGGKIVILGGYLRILPPKADAIQIKTTVSATEHLLHLADKHIRAGRLPVLKSATKEGLLEKARQWEISQYGRPLRPERIRPAGGQKTLFE